MKLEPNPIQWTEPSRSAQDVLVPQWRLACAADLSFDQSGAV